MMKSEKGVVKFRGTESELIADLCVLLQSIKEAEGEEIIEEAYKYYKMDMDERFSMLEGTLKEAVNQMNATLILSQLTQEERERIKKILDENNNTN